MTEGLNSNRYDAVCFSLYRYSLGAKFADFSVPLFYSKTGIYVREDDHRFDKDFSLINSGTLRLQPLMEKCPILLLRMISQTPKLFQCRNLPIYPK